MKTVGPGMVRKQSIMGNLDVYVRLKMIDMNTECVHKVRAIQVRVKVKFPQAQIYTTSRRGIILY